MEHDCGVVFSVVGGVVGFVTLFTGFTPVFSEVSRWGLVVVVVDEVGENSVEGFSFVGKSNVVSTTFAFSSAAIRKEHDGY